MDLFDLKVQDKPNVLCSNVYNFLTNWCKRLYITFHSSMANPFQVKSYVNLGNGIFLR